MKDVFAMFAICIVAIGIGVGLWLYGPDLFREVPSVEDAAKVDTKKESVSFTKLAEGDTAKITTQKNIAVFSEAEMKKLVASVYGADIPALPPVDFGMQYVIATFSGEKTTGGHAVEVTNITDTGSKRVVTITHISPGSRCQVPAVVTSPFQFVVVPYSDLPLVHEDQESILPCD